jgi:hypothetical protein
LRVAQGSELTREERATYEAGLKLLGEEEQIRADANELRQARTAVQNLAADLSKLNGPRLQLDEQIAALKKVFERGTREQLAVQD